MTDKEVMQMALTAFEVATTNFSKDKQEILAAQEALRAALAQPEPKEDGYCQACEENHCTAKTGCVALGNPPQNKWEPQIERKYSPDGVLLSEKIKYTSDGEWQDLKQQPVAWVYVNRDGECEQIEYGKPFDDPSITPLYTAPPQREWVGLTDEDIDAAWKDKLSFSRAIEAKLKEKNT